MTVAGALYAAGGGGSGGGGEASSSGATPPPSPLDSAKVSDSAGSTPAAVPPPPLALGAYQWQARRRIHTSVHAFYSRMCSHLKARLRPVPPANDRAALAWPVLFVGAHPREAPALLSLLPVKIPQRTFHD